MHIITSLAVGGAEMMLFRLLSRMDRKRFCSVVISLSGEGPLESSIRALGIPVHSAGTSGSKKPVQLWRLFRLVTSLKPDIIQGWLVHGSLAATILGLFAGLNTPVLWNIRYTLHGSNTLRHSTTALIRLLAVFSNRPVRIIYNSRVAAQQHEEIGYNERRTVIIPNGLDCEEFHPDLDSRDSLREELGLPVDTALIGLAARFHPVKDHWNFLQAAATLRAYEPDVHFVLIGRGADPLNSELRDRIGRHGLENQVHCLGERSDMPRLTAALDIATCCSRAEAFPNVVAEAMACGIPSVVTDVGDSAWIVGQAGRVVPAQDPEALCRVWLDLLRMRSQERTELGHAARARIRAEFSIDRIAARYEDLYSSLVCG